MYTRLIVALTVACLAALWTIAPAAGATGSAEASVQQSAQALAGEVRLDFKVNRFVRQGDRLIARGTAVGTYTSPTGEVRQESTPVVFRVLQQQGRTCLVLRLRLDALTLNLLGLVIRLEQPVILTITANPREGILGRLFCSLARGSVLDRQPATARELNRVVRSGGLTSASLGAPLASGIVQQQLQACPILTLILGPLDLRLLGLRVHLTRVHLTITAERGALLGDLLCSLSTPAPVIP